MGWSCLCLGYKRGVCFRGTQLGALICESLDNPVRLVLGPSTVVRTEDERWMMEKGNLIAYHLLGSSTCANIEWLVNEPMWLLIKIEYKDAYLVMLPADAINPQAR